MNYQQTIDYLYNALPMFSRMGSAAFKKDLHNIRLLCEALDNPHRKFKTIHVAGTNGKGSVSHMLAAIMQTAGYKTGLYTSPHLYDFRERIKLNGEMVDEDFVIGFVETIQPLIKKIEPSFFEITVAMAFDYFAKMKIDIAVIEVGLGGRLDSTNIITPELSVITNIGRDHMNLLGDTLEEIAFEKGGIIKPGVPVVIGERQPGIDNIFEQLAREKNASIYFASDELKSTAFQWKDGYLEIDVLSVTENQTARYRTDLPGIYQLKNICTAINAAGLLVQSGELPNRPDLSTPLQNVKKLTGLYGRWELLRQQPLVVLDVAHNTEGIRQVLHHLDQLHFDQLHIIIGMVKDKEVDEVLDLLPRQARYYFTQATIPRALDASSLKQKAEPFSLKGDHFENVNSALQNAISEAGASDLIIVCGSIFLIAEVDRNLISQLP